MSACHGDCTVQVHSPKANRCRVIATNKFCLTLLGPKVVYRCTCCVLWVCTPCRNSALPSSRATTTSSSLSLSHQHILAWWKYLELMERNCIVLYICLLRLVLCLAQLLSPWNGTSLWSIPSYGFATLSLLLTSSFQSSSTLPATMFPRRQS